MCAGICSINLMDTCAQGSGTEKKVHAKYIDYIWSSWLAGLGYNYIANSDCTWSTHAQAVNNKALIIITFNSPLL